MTQKRSLTDHEKACIALAYTQSDESQTDLADAYGVSRRTIQRALQERGVLNYQMKKPRYVTQEEEQILARVKRRGLNPDSLERVFNAPALTKDSVQLFLSKLSPADYADTLYVVGYLKVQGLARHRAANQAINKDKEAANG